MKKITGLGRGLDALIDTSHISTEGSSSINEVSLDLIIAIERPLKELEAFDRITLKGGETKTVTLEFPVSELAHWDMETNGWVLEPGKIEILVGSASNDIRQTIQTEIK